MTHVFDPSILREYDVRGIFGHTLGAADADALGRAFAARVRQAGGRRVVVGRDGRLSSPLLEAALVEGLAAGGADVIRIGLGSTPMLYFAEAVLGADAGVMVTGSHNPRDHNGFKFVLGHQPFFGADISVLGDAAAGGEEDSAPGRVDEAEIFEAYLARLLSGYGGGAFRVGWDCGNGAAGPAVAALVARLPGEHHLLHAEVDGHFPNHHPDPSDPRNLADLAGLIAEKGLDFGFAFDGDGDRVVPLDGQGQPIWGDRLLALLARPLLDELPGSTVIFDSKASRAACDHVTAMGGKPLLWKAGHSLIKAKMIETGAPLGGETTGHIAYAHGWYGFDDGLHAALRMMDALGHDGRPLAACLADIPQTAATPEIRIAVAEDRKFGLIATLRARLRIEGAEIDETDGVRVATPDGWWLVRASNTEAAIALRAEAGDAQGLDRVLAEAEHHLGLSGLACSLRSGH